MGKTLDFSSVGEKVVLDEGMYVVTIKSVKEKVASTGKDMWLVCFEEEETKAVIFENYVLDPACAWKVKELLNAIGLEVPADNFELPEPCDLQGLVVKAKVVQGEYNGEPKNEIKKVFAC